MEDDQLRILQQQWRKDGYAVLRGHFSLATIKALRLACEKILTKHRERDAATGQPADRNANSVRHLLRPEYAASDSEEFRLICSAISDESLIKFLSKCFAGPPVFRDTHLWVEPEEREMNGQWHRGTQFRFPLDKSEQSILSITRLKLSRVHIPLYSDNNVQIVPGSHLRWDNQEEYRIRKADDMIHSRSHDILGANRMDLEPGDVLMFDPSVIHRGRYQPGKPRRTLMPTYSTVDVLEMYSSCQPWLNEKMLYNAVSRPIREFLDRSRRLWLDYEWRRGPDLFYWFP